MTNYSEGNIMQLTEEYIKSAPKKVAKSKPSVSKPTPAKPKKPSVAELKKLTKVQLLDYADKNNIKVKRSGSKAEVVKAISTSK